MTELTRIKTQDDLEDLKKFVSLTKQKKSMEEELKDIQSELDRLESLLISFFEEQGIQKISVDGRTVYIRRQLWMKQNEGTDKQAACNALKQAGLEDFVKENFNVQTISSYARELDQQGEKIPTSLKKYFNVDEVFRVVVLKK